MTSSGMTPTVTPYNMPGGTMSQPFGGGSPPPPDPNAPVPGSAADWLRLAKSYGYGKTGFDALVQAVEQLASPPVTTPAPSESTSESASESATS